MAKKHNSKIVDFVKKWRMEFAVFTALTYFVAMVLVIVFFPDVSNLWVSIFVLVSGFTASLTTLSDLLVSAEETSSPEQDEGGIIDNK
jgi:uncharacterized Tic20 family protein